MSNLEYDQGSFTKQEKDCNGIGRNSSSGVSTFLGTELSKFGHKKEKEKEALVGEESDSCDPILMHSIRLQIFSLPSAAGYAHARTRAHAFGLFRLLIRAPLSLPSPTVSTRIIHQACIVRTPMYNQLSNCIAVFFSHPFKLPRPRGARV